jgi:hypothetical protein
VPGAFGGLDQPVEAFGRGGGLVRGQAVPDQGGGAGAWIQVQGHAAFLHRAAIPAPPQVGVDRVQRPVQPVGQLFGGPLGRRGHEPGTQPVGLLVGEVPVGRVEVVDEDACLAAVEVTLLQGREHLGEAFAQRGGEREFPVGGGGGPGEPGGDLVGGPLELLLGPCDGLGPVAFQVADGDGVADLDHPGEQLGLVVGHLPGSGLRHLDQPRVRNLLPGQRIQHGGQLRAGR